MPNHAKRNLHFSQWIVATRFRSLASATYGRETKPMWHYYHEAMRVIERMGPQEWLLALLAVVLWGLFCMRGFGSRSSY